MKTRRKVVKGGKKGDSGVNMRTKREAVRGGKGDNSGRDRFVARKYGRDDGVITSSKL